MDFEVEIESLEIGWTKFTIIDKDVSRGDFFERMHLVYMEFIDEGMMSK